MNQVIGKAVPASPPDLVTLLRTDAAEWDPADPGTAILERRAADEIDRLRGLLNSPETEDFLKGVQLEAAHQRERWGAPHDREKSAEHWYWLVGYLAGKALRSAITGDMEKARHHTISSAAALLHWHTAITQDTSGTGRGRDADLQAHDDGRQAHETAPVRP